MYDVIRLKRREATINKIKLKLPLKFGNPSYTICRSKAVSGWFPFPLLVASLPFRRIFMTHMPLSNAEKI